jgi:predicted DNA-binding transcriptional regulator AlpA
MGAMTRNPHLPALAGFAEAADVVGLTRRRVTQLIAEGQFPEPEQRLRATPVWRVSDLVRWRDARERRRGT